MMFSETPRDGTEYRMERDSENSEKLQCTSIELIHREAMSHLWPGRWIYQRTSRENAKARKQKRLSRFYLQLH